ncbi:MAG: TIGR03905 family TSCPD domain-containing protein [Spirochaetaceae bacterium]|jgi:uncharacterized protein (TIGR03905 family)|nr:TIGR03905 family TSCPD domain-containing protein [Spirochaetaceae bacterium]
MEYTPRGVCSSKIRFDLRDGKVYSVSFEDGCNGNLKALSVLVEGMAVSELVEKLRGINCGGKGTSCADQLARAVLSVNP